MLSWLCIFHLAVCITQGIKNPKKNKVRGLAQRSLVTPCLFLYLFIYLSLFADVVHPEDIPGLCWGWTLADTKMLFSNYSYRLLIRIQTVMYACVLSHLSCIESLRSYGPYLARLLCLWDAPGMNTGVHCHALLQELLLIQDWTCIYYVSCIGRQVLYHNCNQFATQQMNYVYSVMQNIWKDNKQLAFAKLSIHFKSSLTFWISGCIDQFFHLHYNVRHQIDNTSL